MTESGSRLVSERISKCESKLQSLCPSMKSAEYVRETFKEVDVIFLLRLNSESVGDVLQLS